MTTYTRRIIIAMNPDGSHKGSAVFDCDVVNGREFERDPRPISADDADEMQTVMASLQVKTAIRVEESEAQIIALQANAIELERLHAEQINNLQTQASSLAESYEARVSGLKEQIAQDRQAWKDQVGDLSARISVLLTQEAALRQILKEAEIEWPAGQA